MWGRMFWGSSFEIWGIHEPMLEETKITNDQKQTQTDLSAWPFHCRHLPSSLDFDTIGSFFPDSPTHYLYTRNWSGTILLFIIGIVDIKHRVPCNGQLKPAFTIKRLIFRDFNIHNLYVEMGRWKLIITK